jgi:hypothetical protein
MSNFASSSFDPRPDRISIVGEQYAPPLTIYNDQYASILVWLMTTYHFAISLHNFATPISCYNLSTGCRKFAADILNYDLIDNMLREYRNIVSPIRLRNEVGSGTSEALVMGAQSMPNRMRILASRKHVLDHRKAFLKHGVSNEL